MWLVLKGKLSVQIYDIDRKKIKNLRFNNSCRCSCRFISWWSSSMKVDQINTDFYEIKNGPYNKKIKDIEYLNQNF